MKFAFYKGTSIISKAIRWYTRGQYSHVAVILDDGRIIEAWHNPASIRIINSLSEGHTKGTVVDIFEVKLEDEAAAINYALSCIGIKYDFLGIFGFISHKDLDNRGKMFCSEFAMNICLKGKTKVLRRVPSYKVSPSYLSTSPLFKYVRTIKTT